MKIAIKFSSTFGGDLFDKDGKIIGENSGIYLLKKIIGLWDEVTIISDEDVWYNPAYGYVVKPLKKIDVNNTVIINFDVIDSPALYNSLKKSVFAFPKIVNFVWFNFDEYNDKIQLGMLAQSIAQFPTLYNSKMSYTDGKKLIADYCSYKVSKGVLAQYSNLGIELDSYKALVSVPRGVPKLIYPSMYFFSRKQPQRFLDIVSEVRKGGVKFATDIYINPTHYDKAREMTAGIGSIGVSNLVPRDQYYQNLADHDVFLATAQNESYGLSYLEALYAGEVGIFPNRPWVKNILPDWYPFVYKDKNEAVVMLRYVLTHLDEAKKEVEPIKFNIEEMHNVEVFKREFKASVEKWYPNRT